MALLKDKLMWAGLVGAVLSGGLSLVAIGYLGLVVYSGLVSGTPIVEVLLDIAVPALLGIGSLFVLFVVSCIGFVWALVRSASLPRSDRTASLAGRLEREYPPLRIVGLSELLEPPEPSAEERAEEALATLKRRYVDGRITEAEFERKVNQLVANDSIDEARAARERNHAVDAESNRS